MPYKPMFQEDIDKLVDYFKDKPFILAIEEKKLEPPINEASVNLPENANKLGTENRIYFNKDSEFPKLKEEDLCTKKSYAEFNDTINRIDLGKALIKNGYKIGRNNC